MHQEEKEERFYSPFGGNGAYWTQNSVSLASERRMHEVCVSISLLSPLKAFLFHARTYTPPPLLSSALLTSRSRRPPSPRTRWATRT
jgi:hypothetical protein